MEEPGAVTSGLSLRSAVVPQLEKSDMPGELAFVLEATASEPEYVEGLEITPLSMFMVNA